MRIRCSICLFLLLVFSSLFSLARADENMKYCVDYIRSSEDLAPYVLVDNNAEFSKETLNALVKQGSDRNVQYKLTDGHETITSNDGIYDVQVDIVRENRKLSDISVNRSLSSIVQYHNFGAPSGGFMAGGPYGGIGFGGGFTDTKTKHKFRYINGKCVPDSRSQGLDSPNLKSGGIELFKISHCRDLHEFFKKYPQLEQCSNTEVVSKLDNLVKNGLDPGKISYGSVVAPPPSYETGNLWFVANSRYSQCLANVGVKSAMEDDSLWVKIEKPVKSQEVDGSETQVIRGR